MLFRKIYNKNFLKIFIKNTNESHYIGKRFLNSTNSVILGIETSCDDTGCAVVNSKGNILGEALNSQLLTHLKHGGIIPPIAQDLHRRNIESVVNSAIESSAVPFDDIDAIAVTVKPGLPLSLTIGMKYGKYLCRLHNKPFIPIHHMEAHALTARMYDRSLEFPFLVLLISGGHCLLSLVQNIDDFLLLGQTINDAPGEAYDKMARRLKLRIIPEYAECSSGHAIETAASCADNPFEFDMTPSLFKYQDCNFSFAGIKNQMTDYIIKEEKKYDLPPDKVLPSVNNLCAAFQYVVTRHLCHRVQRAMAYVKLNNLIPPGKQTLVVSGGVACNNFIARGLQIVCDELNYKLVRPPPKLCTDNGVMIAWNGVERWRLNKGVTNDLNSISVEKTSLLGKNISTDVASAKIRLKWIQLKSLFDEKVEQNKT